LAVGNVFHWLIGDLQLLQIKVEELNQPHKGAFSPFVVLPTPKSQHPNALPCAANTQKPTPKSPSTQKFAISGCFSLKALEFPIFPYFCSLIS
jgi:hypothetical protein